MSRLLNDGPECEDVISGLICRSEPRLSPSSKESLLKHTFKPHMKDRSIELKKRVSHHTRYVVVWIYVEAQFKDRVDSMM